MSTAPNSHQLVSAAVIAAGTLFFLAAAGKLAWAHISQANDDASRAQQAVKPTGEKRYEVEENSEGKPPSASMVQVTYATTPTMCFSVGSSSDPRPAVLAGPLLKMIDVVASICARRHCGASCVTVSVDAVLFLRPIYLGELIHLSAAVNRSWSSSMEIGVKILKEDPEKNGKLTYVSHSYLTFVAVQSSTFTGASKPGSTAAPEKLKGKVRVPPLLPRTPLEMRRYMLAGRRRQRRMEIAKQEAETGASRGKWGVPASVEKALLQEVVKLGSDLSTSPLNQTSARAIAKQRAALDELELEFIVQALCDGEEGIVIDRERNLVRVAIEQDNQYFTRPLQDLLRTAKQMGISEERLLDKHTSVKAVEDYQRRMSFTQDPPSSPKHSTGARRSLSPSWRRASTVSFVADASAPRRPSLNGRDSNWMSSLEMERIASTGQADGGEDALVGETSQDEHQIKIPKDSIPMTQTVTRSLALVFPEKTNSNGVLFGGDLMGWMEDVALMACRTLANGRRFSIVALDGLEFKQAVQVGETLFFTAVVIRTFSQSAEVYVVAEATSREGQQRRVANHALFTAACAPVASHTSSANGNASQGTSQTVSSPSLYCSPEVLSDPKMVRTGSRLDAASAAAEANRRILKVDMPPGSALETFAEAASARRHERLALRDMLLRLYAFDDDD